MRAFEMVVLQEFSNEKVKVPLAKHHEVIEALLSERLDEPLDESARVGRSVGGPLHPKTRVLETCRGCVLSFGVPSRPATRSDQVVRE